MSCAYYYKLFFSFSIIFLNAMDTDLSIRLHSDNFGFGEVRADNFLGQ